MEREPTLVRIRSYRKKDRKSIRDIAVKTSFLGQPIKFFINDRELISDVLTVYYTDYEPESCFVALSEGKVIGYVIGSTNVRRMRSVFRSGILPGVVKAALARRVFINRNTLKFIFSYLISFFKGEFRTPDFSKEYPATLHVNLVEGYRGSGTGSKLILRYLRYLKKNNIRGVHFSTRSKKAKKFFRKLGFNILYEGKVSYMRSYFNRSLPYYIFGRKLINYNGF